MAHHDPVVAFALAGEPKGDLHPFAPKENVSRKK